MYYELRNMDSVLSSVPQPFAFIDISLCHAKTQEEVETDRNVVFVVGNIERDDLLLLSFGILHKGEDQTTIGNARALHLEVIAATIDESYVLHLVPTC